MISIAQKRAEALADYKNICEVTNRAPNEALLKRPNVNLLETEIRTIVKKERTELLKELGIKTADSVWSEDLADKIKKISALFDFRVFPTVEEAKTICEAPFGRQREVAYSKLRDRIFE